MTTGRIAVFFYLAFMDEEKAIHATRRVITQRKAKVSAKTSEAAEARTVWRLCMSEIRGESLSSARSVAPSKAFVLPEGFDIEKWRRFCVQADAKETLAVLAYWILKIPMSMWTEISGETEGTYRFRLSQALQRWIRTT